MNRIYEKLNEINDLNDRVMLKKILNSVFTSLEQHSEDRFNDLEERVFDEIQYLEEKYNVYSTIIDRKHLDVTNEFLFPVIEEDTEEKIYDVKTIIDNLNDNVSSKMFNIFLKCDYSIFKQFISNNSEITGTIETDKKIHKAYFKVKANTEYKEKINTLYKCFINNNIMWKTVNMPYINKIAQIFLTKCEDQIDEEEEIVKINIDFGDYSKYIKYDMVPLWNIKEIKLKCAGFPVPCIDKVNFEHDISIEKEGTNHGYLVNLDEENMDYVTIKKNYISITSKISDSSPWLVYKIVNYKEDNTKKDNYEIMSNYKNVNFSNRFLFNNRYVIKTKSEIAKLINSFEASKHLRFRDLKIEELKFDEDKETYDANDFIIDEIREDNIKKSLVLYFEPKNKENYLNNDILSFLVSEIQIIYPEYKCEGRLI
ncbi:normocyte-binding protein [Clostridium botulinum]|uniref:normocyte-binding protein n=1 Tax=Clostridium botulinum TaxID=1491 RepID=UPI0013F0E8F0|nr:normocyte-binding protein [Clostridium botulinum]MBN1074117.1 normocyte-binding protein [Clostridium botulinum]MBY6837947.1 normocyte-binding protein [Clostridium botulinum]NFG63826.1 normocyte-binding protein [Clostridium botulinum]NFL34379.1 normocyte-binding protein [Clostridium botulinum]NFM04027.1 normocyte-binding protein [Clostridium botulinum]